MAFQARERELEVRELELKRKESVLAIRDKDPDPASAAVMPDATSAAMVSPEEIANRIDRAIAEKNKIKATKKAQEQ